MRRIGIIAALAGELKPLVRGLKEVLHALARGIRLAGRHRLTAWTL